MQQRAARSPDLNRVAIEYALGDAAQAHHIAQLARVPEVSNALAEALSRRSTPDPEPFPAEL
eukprot:6344291-Alexandrium_andersonii.AAC.1